MANTSIEWTRGDDGTEGRVWNCLRGCSRISAGCGDATGGGCYAERMAHRFSAPGLPYNGLTRLTKSGARWTGDVVFVPEMLDAPLHWRKPSRIFVNSMSDWCHPKVTNEQRAAMFGVMAACPQHEFQLLTKRPAEMLDWFKWLDEQRNDDGTFPLTVDLLRRHLTTHKINAPCAPSIEWPLPNVHLGVTCENQPTADERIPLLLQCPAAVHWISVEPMLSSIVVPQLNELQWVVCGGESGSNARPMHPAWPRSLRDQCRDAGVPFFLKQWGEWAPWMDESKFYATAKDDRRDRWQPWMLPDGTSGTCEIYDDDATWTNWTGDPGNNPDDICVFSRVGKKAAGHILDGQEYRMRPGDSWEGARDATR